PPTVSKEKKGKKTGKGKQKAKELETISEAILTEAEQLKIITKRSHKETHSSHASGSGVDEGTGVSPGVPNAPDYDSDDDISWKSSADDQDDDDEAHTKSEDDGDDFIHPKLTTYDDETTHEEETDEDDTFDPIVHTPSLVSSSDDEDSDNEVEGVDVKGEKEIEDTHVTLTLVNPDGQQQSSSVSSGFVSNMLNPNQDTVEPSFSSPTKRPANDRIPPRSLNYNNQHCIRHWTYYNSSSLQNLPNFASLFGFDYRLKALEDNFSELRQTNQYAKALSSIPGIVDHYLANKMQEAVDVAIQLKRTSQKEFSTKFTSINIEKTRAEKDLIEQRYNKHPLSTSRIQRPLYKGISVNAYEADKIQLDTYGDNRSHKKTHETEQDEIARTLHVEHNRGSKRIRSGKEPASTSAPRETTTTTAGKTTTTGSKTHKQSASQSAPVEETMQTTDVFEAPAHQEFETGPTFELMKGTCKSLTELEYFCEEVYKATTEKLDWINPEGRQYPHDLRQPLPLVPISGRHVIPFHHFINNDLEYLCVKYDKFALWESQIGAKSDRQDSMHLRPTKESACDDLLKKKNDCCHKGGKKFKCITTSNIDWITINWRDDDILYKFKEGDFQRLRIQDIEDMLLLLVQGKVTNLNVEERIAFNVSLRMFTRSVVIQRRVEDLQLGVESYQKKLNLTKPDTYRSNLRRRDAYTPYSDPRGFIYENKDKKNRLMRIDELHKFSDGTLDDVRTALNDRLKGIRMEYLPQTFWS
ncbi:hypothetical protein Tco_0870679, partial [Tanacetum coccineum]